MNATPDRMSEQEPCSDCGQPVFWDERAGTWRHVSTAPEECWALENGTCVEANTAVERPEDLEVWQTGGGCTAWGRRFDNAGYMLVTLAEDPMAPAFSDEQVAVGLYDAEGSEWVTFQGLTAQEFLAKWNDAETGLAILRGAIELVSRLNTDAAGFGVGAFKELLGASVHRFN